MGMKQIVLRVTYRRTNDTAPTDLRDTGESGARIRATIHGAVGSGEQTGGEAARSKARRQPAMKVIDVRTKMRRRDILHSIPFPNFHVFSSRWRRDRRVGAGAGRARMAVATVL